jgi:hypothetical protein
VKLSLVAVAGVLAEFLRTLKNKPAHDSKAVGWLIKNPYSDEI